MEPVSTTVISYVALKFLDQFIKDEGYGRVKKILFPKKKYINRLIEVIQETINNFEKLHPYDNSNGMFPFYHSQIVFDHLTQFVLFNNIALESIKYDFSQYPKIIPPTTQELESFFTLFVSVANNDPVLKTTFIEENYKKQIFQISEAIEEIKVLVSAVKKDTSAIKDTVDILYAESEAKKLTPKKTSIALNAQVVKQLKKQISSGKYLPKTFIETGEQKNSLRYLCDSFFYLDKWFEETKILDFRYLNILLEKQQSLPYSFNLENLKPVEKISFRNINEVITKYRDYLINKKEEIVSFPLDSYKKSPFESKFRDKLEDIEFLNGKLALITESAGQGKTNFLCDFSENFLLKRNIPFIFLTGAEVNANDIRKSIIQRVYPDSPNYSFEEFLDSLKLICESENKYFVLIIDGINENYDSKLFSQNLEFFLTEILEQNFIKVILSCRTEYYQQNFNNLEKASFTKEMKKITSLLTHRTDDDLKDKLLEIYFDFFKIECHNISSKAHQQLVDNFLLLRIFCETYQNQKLQIIENIYKEPLFEKYYRVKSDEINNRLKSNDEFKVSGSFDIKNFIHSITEFMIENKVYINVPLDKVIANPNDRQMYIRFLDENILVKRDIQVDEMGVFTSQEVVNFTFDEFRDFLLSCYLVEVLYKKSPQEFTTFIESQVTFKSPLLEGCSTFLFFVSRRRNDKVLTDILQNQPWFEEVFSDCLFSLKDSQITEDDKKILKGTLINNPLYNDSIIWNLIIRYDTEYYKNLNIEFLFEILRELEETEYYNCFTSKFETNRWGEFDKINQENLVNQIGKLLEKIDTEQANKKYKKLFELLIYMFTNSNHWIIQNTYEKYIFRYSEEGKNQIRTALNSKNKSLITNIEQFIGIYEISL